MSQMASALRLRTLGGLAVERNPPLGPGAAAQRRPLALLALLAAASERGVSRDKLLACLWPESSQEKARHLLTQTLYALRRDLHARVQLELVRPEEQPLRVEVAPQRDL